MSKYSEPNFFCGECPHNLAYGEVSPELDKQIKEHCHKDCVSWRTQQGASLYTLNGVYQCWQCINHMPKYDEVVKDEDGIWVCYPYCGQYQETIHKLDINTHANGKCFDWSLNK